MYQCTNSAGTPARCSGIMYIVNNTGQSFAYTSSTYGMIYVDGNPVTTDYASSITNGSYVGAWGFKSLVRVLKNIKLNASVNFTQAISSTSTVLFTLPTGARPAITMLVLALPLSGQIPILFAVGTDGTVKLQYGSIASNVYYVIDTNFFTS